MSAEKEVDIFLRSSPSVCTVWRVVISSSKRELSVIVWPGSWSHHLWFFAISIRIIICCLIAINQKTARDFAERTHRKLGGWRLPLRCWNAAGSRLFTDSDNAISRYQLFCLSQQLSNLWSYLETDQIEGACMQTANIAVLCQLIYSGQWATNTIAFPHHILVCQLPADK